MRAVKLFRQILQDVRGATAIEYGLIVALVCLSAMVALEGVADENTGLWARVKNQISAVM